MLTEPSFSLGPLMKAARKFKKYNQADVARAIGCSQSALSKMEHNLLVPSAPQWFLFSRFTMIPPEALESGIIDRHTRIKFNSDEVSLGFKLPRKFLYNRSIKVKELYPFIAYVEKKVGENGLKNFLNELQIEPEFFLDFDNLINFSLYKDFIALMIKHGYQSEDTIRQIVREGQNDIYWGHPKKDWKKYTSVGELLEAYGKDQAYHQVDFKLLVEPQNSNWIVTYQPEPHLQEMDISLEIMDFIKLYQRHTLEHLIENILGKKPQVHPDIRVSDKIRSRFEIV